MVRFKTEVRYPKPKQIPKDFFDKVILAVILGIKVVLNTFMPFFFGFYYGFTEKPLFLLFFVVLVFFNVDIEYGRDKKMKIKIIRTL